MSSDDESIHERQHSVRSIKSIKSNYSNQSKQSKNQLNHHKTIGYKTKLLPKKRTSVMDSDTESSRLRKMSNNRASPFRQASNINNAAKKTPKKQLIKYEDRQNRSRSKSRQKREQPSMVTSNMMTDNYSDSSDDERMDNFLNQLKQRNHTRKDHQKNVVRKGQKRSSSKQKTAIQQKCSNLEEMIKKAARAVKKV